MSTYTSTTWSLMDLFPSHESPEMSSASCCAAIVSAGF